MSQPPIFHAYTFGEQEREKLDRDGHLVLPGVLTPDAQENLTRSLSRIHELSRTPKKGMNRTDFLQNTTVISKA